MITLLIVDDEHWTRDAIKTFVDSELWGINQLDEAENGKQAIEKVRKKRPDIIITDMKMPGVDGIDLLNVLRIDYPEIPVIVLSGYQEFIYTRQAIKAKVVEYLPKPVDKEELNQAIGKAVTQKRKLEQQQISLPLFYSEHPAISSLLDSLYSTLAFSLKELNEQQFESTFEQFGTEIPGNLKSNEDYHFQFHQKFIGLIKEVINQHNITLEELGLERKDFIYDSAIPVEMELIHMQLVGKMVIQKIKDSTSQKSRINLNDIKRYIEENYSSPELSLDILSKKFYVSKEYLTTAFKKKFGCNITEFIISYRMNKAKELIQTTTLKYKTISIMVSYEDVSYFYRLFKKVHGNSPGSLRKD